MCEKIFPVTILGKGIFAGDSCSGRRHTLISLTDERTVLVPGLSSVELQWFVYILREASVTMRLLITWLTVDSAKDVEIFRPCR